MSTMRTLAIAATAAVAFGGLAAPAVAIAAPGPITVANYCDDLKAKEDSARTLAAAAKKAGDLKNYQYYTDLATRYHKQYLACIRT